MTAHGLGVAREAARQIGGAQSRTCPDQAAARLLARRSGWRSRSAGSNAGPRSAAIGTKSRRRQAMISEMSPSAFSCGTMPSVKPVSSTRCAFITSERRICSPPARSSTAPRSITALQASDGKGRGRRRRRGLDRARASASGVTRRPITRSPIVGLEAVDAHILRPAAGPKSAATGR